MEKLRLLSKRPLETDTITAIATPPGRGGIGIIRISGPNTSTIANALLGGLPKPRYAEYRDFFAQDGSCIDRGLALYFPAPHSFTGEDILELHGHGGTFILDSLLKRIFKIGARIARPGEFSERAFLNGKLDLIQAEAISDLINAESEEAARAAVRSMQGEFSKRINLMIENLIALRTYLEASIDFSDEAIDFLKQVDFQKKIENILLEIQKIKRVAKQGTLLQEGISIAIIGPPNAGKSSLLNRLSGNDSAIVAPIAGTTRDVIREKILLDGLLINIVDTAGLRKTSDIIEQEGIKRTFQEIEKADHIFYVVDARLIPPDNLTLLYSLDFWGNVINLPNNKQLTVVRNKIDLNRERANMRCGKDFNTISLSIKTGDGVHILLDYLKSHIDFNGTEGNFSARRRHLEALDKAEIFLTYGLDKLSEGQFPELLAEDLAIAQNHLNEITGQFTTEDLLGKIFSDFCIGK
jgi:tRNA modification GTPase